MSDDDNNDRLMAQFIEKATPKLLEAMQASLAEKIEEQIGGLKQASQKMLDEIKDQKRAAAEQATKDKGEADQFRALLSQRSNPADINAALTPDPIRLTRVQARDPQLYRRAKAQAEKTGTTVEIVND
ncbi:hypothetical protein U879_17560 [Defluviimonas sp. 20V17]|uniref:Uncharacterized protein n=1 Tax=Allgaiera indica TaxID=765699 RepID=A0AAN4URT1_9RHOB|nr:hypothetical protein [Allgaiera indica]KDB02394.1 hypothetical protein U879_17560 [Defluviimonas sp. 20V17]GHE02180.1 hypothetical protein GCM10008024_20760 [Allgaiera indica]SDX06218.1 hypothetical protein SAMN05444006_109130 [Allgaiera indica]